MTFCVPHHHHIISHETSSAENDLRSNSEIKPQTQDITNLQDVCSIEDISSEKVDEEYKKRLVMRLGKEIGKKSAPKKY